MIYNIKFINKKLMLLVNKNIFISSHQMIQKIKKIMVCDKIGHSGTLDPLAFGLLIVCFDTKTKLLNKIIGYKKEYIAFTILGLESDTFDIDGKIKYFNFNGLKLIKNKSYIKYNILSLKNQKLQKPMLFSSIKHNGFSIYKYARLNIKINLKKKQIEVYDIKFVYITDNILIFKILCSKGTYVRSIIEYINISLHIPLCLFKLVRLRIGKNNKILNSFNFF